MINLKPGPQLDVEVNKKFFASDHTGYLLRLYSTEESAAQHIWDKLIMDGWIKGVAIKLDDGSYKVSVLDPHPADKNKSEFSAIGETFPHALCLLAIKVSEDNND